MKTLWTSVVIVGVIIGSCFGTTTNVINSPSTTENGGDGVWTQDLDAAKKLAKETGHPLLLNFTGSDWCGWCMRMNEQVFSTMEWKYYAKNNLVLVTIDFPQKNSLVPANFAMRNSALQRYYKIKGYPTYILLSSDGRELGRLVGGCHPLQNFIDSVSKIVNPELIANEQIAKLGDTDKMTYDVFAREREEIQDELQAWLDTKPNLVNALMKRKHDDFYKRIDAVGKKIDTLLNLVQERTKIQEELQAWLDTKPNLQNALIKSKQGDFQKRIDVVNKKIGALIEKR